MSGVINDLIREIVVDMGATAMTITHDMTSVRTIADDIAMLHAGRIQWTVGVWINLASLYRSIHKRTRHWPD